jgi:processive 1,2-diacylglycerol beta-glucosyltransferase
MDARPDDHPRPRVLVTTASVGAGHHSVTGAIVEALRSAGGGEAAIDVDTVDVLDFTPRLFRFYYAGGFATLMSKLPWLYGVGFRLTNRPDSPRRTLMERRRLLTERLCLQRFVAYLRQTRPTLVISTHFVAAPAIAHMIRREPVHPRQMVVVTDICVHRFWYAQNVERWFVPADVSADRLRGWGVDDDRITVTGIPVHAKWTRPVDLAAARAEWHLPADRKSVVLTGGTAFTCGPVAAIARRLLARCPGLHLVVLTGRDRRLLQRLRGFDEAGRRMSVVPFTRRVHQLVGASALVVTKAGGVATAECLAAGKPMVLLKPVPGHEAGNAEFLADRGAAVIARRHADVAPAVERLLGDAAALSRLSAGARGLYRPATETVVTAVRRALGRPASSPPGAPAGA